MKLNQMIAEFKVPLISGVGYFLGQLNIDVILSRFVLIATFIYTAFKAVKAGIELFKKNKPMK